jgi:hypothetical protein
VKSLKYQSKEEFEEKKMEIALNEAINGNEYFI